MDTTTRKCKICENEFDSIFEIDNGICDECLETTKEFIELQNQNREDYKSLNS